MIGAGRPFYAKIRRDIDSPPCKTPIFNLFSLVAPQPWHLAKSSVNTNRKSTTHFSNEPKINIVKRCPYKLSEGGSKTQSPKMWTIGLSCDDSETVRGQLVRIRAFDWYRPRWPWMTLNGVIALIFSPNSIALLANYVTVIQDRPIVSAKNSPIQSFTFGQY